MDYEAVVNALDKRYLDPKFDPVQELVVRTPQILLPPMIPLVTPFLSPPPPPRRPPSP